MMAVVGSSFVDVIALHAMASMPRSEPGANVSEWGHIRLFTSWSMNASPLGISTLFCSYFYIFEQNWLLTIIHSSYLGFAYLTWLGIVFLFLCDIVFNRARITTEILNAFFNAIGSALSVVPC